VVAALLWGGGCGVMRAGLVRVGVLHAVGFLGAVWCLVSALCLLVCGWVWGVGVVVVNCIVVASIFE
jgi:hypothetical protein